MSGYVLRILKGSRHAGTCRRPCRCRLQWATCAPHGRSVPLVEHPRVLREERNSSDVVFEIIASDQVHTCPLSAPKTTTPATPAPSRKARRAAGMFSTFTPDRIAQLKQQIDGPKDKPPQPGRLW